MFIAPQIPSSATEPPNGGDWLHEIKHDGFRTLLHIDGGKARAFTRNGYDWSARYEPIVKACSRLFCRSALIDGEIIVEDDNGASDFDALPYAIKHDPQRLVFFAFDLLHLNGEDLRTRPLAERRAKLEKLVDPCWTLRFSEHFEGDAQAFFAAAVKHGLEGIVSKRANSRYRSGPSKHWLKIKNACESEFILLGLERDSEGRPFAHVARETSRGLDYAGMAFMAFSEKLYDVLSERAETLTMSCCPINGLRRQRATWLRPEIRVTVRHLRNSNGLRHASVRAIVWVERTRFGIIPWLALRGVSDLVLGRNITASARLNLSNAKTSSHSTPAGGKVACQGG